MLLLFKDNGKGRFVKTTAKESESLPRPETGFGQPYSQLSPSDKVEMISESNEAQGDKPSEEK